MKWFWQDKPFDALGTFEVDRLFMLDSLLRKGRVHHTMIHCHDGRFVLLDMACDHANDLRGMPQIAYDAVVITHMLTTQDDGVEVATAAMIVYDDRAQTSQMHVWKARIQRDRLGAVTAYAPLTHDSKPTSLPPMAGVPQRPTRSMRANVMKILSQIPANSAPWIVK